MTWTRILASAVVFWLVLTSVVSADCEGLVGSELLCCQAGGCTQNGSYVDANGQCKILVDNKCLPNNEAACIQLGLGSDCLPITPEPMTFVSFGLGLAGLGAYVRWRRGQRGTPT